MDIGAAPSGTEVPDLDDPPKRLVDSPTETFVAAQRCPSAKGNADPAQLSNDQGTPSETVQAPLVRRFGGTGLQEFMLRADAAGG